jgi:hypothetical protein
MTIAVAGCSVATVATPVESATPSVAAAVASRSPRPTVKPTPKATPAASPAATATPALTTAPAGSATAWPSDAYPDLTHADRELEALLPASFAGTPLIRFSALGSIFTPGGDMCILICGGEPYRYANELGVSVDGVTIAFATSDKLAIGIIAYRARGAVTKDLIPARIAIGGYTGHGHLYNLPVTIGGRPATYLDAGMASDGEYLMTRDDVLFIVLGEAPSKAECRPGSCASEPPGPWTVPAYVTDAFGAVP